MSVKGVRADRIVVDELHKFHDLHIMRTKDGRMPAKLFLDGEPLLGVQELTVQSESRQPFTTVTITMIVGRVTTD